MIAIIPVIFVILGLLVYALSTNGKISQIGLFTFLGAWTALMITFAGRTIRLFH